MLLLPLGALVVLYLWDSAAIDALCILCAFWAAVRVPYGFLRGETINQGQVEGMLIGWALWAFVIFS